MYITDVQVTKMDSLYKTKKQVDLFVKSSHVNVIVFRLWCHCLSQVTQGSCDRSFGIHVARIANFPAHVVSEAESLANALENGEPLSAHFLDSGAKQSTTPVCQPADNGKPGDSRQEEEEISTGPKRKVADVAGLAESASVGAGEKRSR